VLRICRFVWALVYLIPAMGKKARPTNVRRRARPTCVYCRVAPATTDDHVFPESWYPSTTPAGAEKAKVPSCRPCNQRWSRIEVLFAEEYLIGLDPKAPQIAGVSERLTRAWQPQKAKGPDDAKHRAGKLLKLTRTMKWTDPVPGAPQRWIRTPAGLILKASPARLIGPDLRRSIAEKFIRGFHFVETGQPAPDFEVQCLSQEDAAHSGDQILLLLRNMTRRDHLGPGLLYGWLDGPEKSFWAFHLWGQLSFFAFASPALRPSELASQRTQKASGA
jgi:hypothetical protein